MTDIISVFKKKLIEDELFQSRLHGIKVAVPIMSFIKNKNKRIDNESLPPALQNFYNNLESMMISWDIPKTHQASNEIFKNDPWLIKNYFNEGYEWEVVKEFLSGFINITPYKDIFNPDFCKEQAYYYTLSQLDFNPDEFYPFDIHWSLTACLKKENGKILDNIWLVHTDGEAIYDMKIGVDEYLNLAYQAKIFHYWQLIYVLKKQTDYFELMKRFLPVMVPHVKLDLSKFDIYL